MESLGNDIQLKKYIFNKFFIVNIILFVSGTILFGSGVFLSYSPIKFKILMLSIFSWGLLSYYLIRRLTLLEGLYTWILFYLLFPKKELQAYTVQKLLNVGFNTTNIDFSFYTILNFILLVPLCVGLVKESSWLGKDYFKNILKQNSYKSLLFSLISLGIIGVIGIIFFYINNPIGNFNLKNSIVSLSHIVTACIVSSVAYYSIRSNKDIEKLLVMFSIAAIVLIFEYLLTMSGWVPDLFVYYSLNYRGGFRSIIQSGDMQVCAILTLGVASSLYFYLKKKNIIFLILSLLSVAIIMQTQVRASYYSLFISIGIIYTLFLVKNIRYIIFCLIVGIAFTIMSNAPLVFENEKLEKRLLFFLSLQEPISSYGFTMDNIFDDSYTIYKANLKKALLSENKNEINDLILEIKAKIDAGQATEKLKKLLQMIFDLNLHQMSPDQIRAILDLPSSYDGINLNFSKQKDSNPFSSIDTRIAASTRAIDALMLYPFIGLGAGNSVEFMSSGLVNNDRSFVPWISDKDKSKEFYDLLAKGEIKTNTHNLYTHVIAEYGLLAVLLLLNIAAIMFIKIKQLRESFDNSRVVFLCVLMPMLSFCIYFNFQVALNIVPMFFLLLMIIVNAKNIDNNKISKTILK